MAKKRLKQLKNDVANRIRDVLIEKDWTQQRLADAIGKDKGDISRILSGSVNLTLETIAIIEEALGVSVIRATDKEDELKASTPKTKIIWGKKK